MIGVLFEAAFVGSGVVTAASLLRAAARRARRLRPLPPLPLVVPVSAELVDEDWRRRGQ